MKNRRVHLPKVPLDMPPAAYVVMHRVLQRRRALLAIDAAIAVEGRNHPKVNSILAGIKSQLLLQPKITTKQAACVSKWGLFKCRCGRVASTVFGLEGYCEKHPYGRRLQRAKSVAEYRSSLKAEEAEPDKPRRHIGKDGHWHDETNRGHRTFRLGKG